LKDNFSHRFHPDGTIDAICWECFQTVALRKSEVELEKIEENHNCDTFAHDRENEEQKQRNARATLASLWPDAEK
jgi:hypothetical protein